MGPNDWISRYEGKISEVNFEGNFKGIYPIFSKSAKSNGKFYGIPFIFDTAVELEKLDNKEPVKSKIYFSYITGYYVLPKILEILDIQVKDFLKELNITDNKKNAIKAIIQKIPPLYDKEIYDGFIKNKYKKIIIGTWNLYSLKTENFKISLGKIRSYVSIKCFFLSAELKNSNKEKYVYQLIKKFHSAGEKMLDEAYVFSVKKEIRYQSSKKLRVIEKEIGIKEIGIKEIGIKEIGIKEILEKKNIIQKIQALYFLMKQKEWKLRHLYEKLFILILNNKLQIMPNVKNIHLLWKVFNRESLYNIFCADIDLNKMIENIRKEIKN